MVNALLKKDALTKHRAMWLAPSPLWTNGISAGRGAENGSFEQPTILRFDNDAFMDEILALLAYYPAQLHEWVAGPETWQEPMQTPPTASQLKVIEPVSAFSRKFKPRLQDQNTLNTSTIASDQANGNSKKALSEALPFKLFQPAHQRHYLVSASLVCQQPGLPDLRVDPGRQEKVSFIIRRVVHDVPEKESETPYAQDSPDWTEYAFVATSEGFAWQEVPLDQRGAVAEEEERLPVFAINFNEESGYRRRLFAGSIPIGKREAYLGAQTVEVSGEKEQEGEEGTGLTKLKDPRTALFIAKVTAPWKALIEQSRVIRDKYDISAQTFPNFEFDVDKANADKKRGYKIARDQIQTASWYILLDFANYLQNYMTDDVWDAIKDQTKISKLSIPRQNLIKALGSVTIPGSLKDELAPNIYPPETLYQREDILDDLLSALIEIKANKEYESNLEKVDVNYDRAPRDEDNKLIPVDPLWPTFLFPLADPFLAPLQGPLPSLDYIVVDETGLEEDLEKALARIDAMADLVEAALPALTEPLPEIDIPKVPLSTRDGWFVIRCVYERPNCGPVHANVMSRPTEKFQLASFFDPDAPARPIRVAMPADISPAGLRKYKRNAMFMISDMLCGKIKRIKKLTLGDLVLSVLPWPFHKDLPDPGKTGPCKGPQGDFGMYCSLSIPIVTLAALILLIIIVSLFDVFFRWIPYLFTCFPIPGLKGKKS